MDLKTVANKIKDNLPGVVRNYPWSAGVLVVIGMALGAWLAS